MADLVTVAGGAHASLKSLSPAEHQAAVSALSKLASASPGVSSVLGGSLRSATLSGGSVVHSEGIKVGSSSLAVGSGADTFAGGVSSAAAPVHTIGSDTVVAGSAFSSKIDATKSTASGAHVSLSGDTINVAGTTAASVKSETVQDAKSAGHTITLSDKTTITLTGVSAHDVIKPH